MDVVVAAEVPDQLRRDGDGVGVLRLIVVVPDVGRFLRIPRGAAREAANHANPQIFSFIGRLLLFTPESARGAVRRLGRE